MLTNREVLLVKDEGASYNVDPTPTLAQNAILVEELSWAPANARLIERKPLRTSIGALKSLYGGMLVTVTFTTEIKGSGTAGTAPEIGPLFTGAGCSETVVAVTSVTYKPVSTGHKSVTIWYYHDGTLVKFTGCRGNFTCTMAAGAVGKIQWTFTGHLTTQTDVSATPATYDSTVPGVIIGTTFTVGAYAAVINQLVFDPNNSISAVPSFSATDGFGEVRVTQRDVQGTIDPELVVIATNDFLAQFKSTTSMALATGTIGTAGNRYAVTMPAIAYRGYALGDREGIRTLELPFGAAESAGDDEFSVTFT